MTYLNMLASLSGTRIVQGNITNRLIDFAIFNKSEEMGQIEHMNEWMISYHIPFMITVHLEKRMNEVKGKKPLIEVCVRRKKQTVEKILKCNFINSIAGDTQINVSNYMRSLKQTL